MNALWKRIQEEPAVAISIVGAFMSLLVLFGVPLSDEQQAGVNFFLIVLVGFLTRQMVTPVVAVDAKVADAKATGRAEVLVEQAMSPAADLTDEQIQAELDEIEQAVRERDRARRRTP